jgi:hypothetical protein
MADGDLHHRSLAVFPVEPVEPRAV